MATESMRSPQTRADSARSAALWCAAGAAAWWALLGAAANTVFTPPSAGFDRVVVEPLRWFAPALALVVAVTAAARRTSNAPLDAALRAAVVGCASYLLTAIGVVGLIVVPHALFFGFLTGAGSLSLLASDERSAEAGSSAVFSVSLTAAATLTAAAVYAAFKTWRWAARPPGSVWASSSTASSSPAFRAACLIVATATCAATALCVGSAFRDGSYRTAATLTFVASMSLLAFGLGPSGGSRQARRT